MNNQYFFKICRNAKQDGINGYICGYYATKDDDHTVCSMTECSLNRDNRRPGEVKYTKLMKANIILFFLMIIANISFVILMINAILQLPNITSRV
jgi:hypothetical protein